MAADESTTAAAPATPLFVGPSLVWLVIFIGTLCLSLSTVALLLRFYVKIVIMKKIRREDYTSFAAWIFFTAMVIDAFMEIPLGLGKHVDESDNAALFQLGRSGLAFQVLYCIVIFLVKLSILWQYLTIFVPVRPSASYYIVWTIIWVNGLFYTALFFVRLFQCVPQERIWNTEVPGHCLVVDTFTVTAAMNVVSDFVMLILPLYWISRLQMARKKKLQVAVVFAFGAFACIASIFRAVKSVAASQSLDLTYNLVAVGGWMMGEIAGGLVAFCLPVLPRLASHFRQSVRSSSFSRTLDYTADTKTMQYSERHSRVANKSPHATTTMPTAYGYGSHGAEDGLELSEHRNHRDGPETETVIKGGTSSMRTSEEALVEHEWSDLENGNGNIKVVREVRVEKYPGGRD